MARRTKQDAQATRERILDAAEQVFEARGVAGTTLHHIASAAGLTRGAIYWHFTDKADLFNAMMERTTLPLEALGGVGIGAGAQGGARVGAQVGARVGVPVGASKARARGLEPLVDGLVAALRRVATDPRAARVFDIVSHKVEYAGETHSLRARHLEGRNACVADIERTFAAARRRGELPGGVPARAAAIGLHALLDGLLRSWMLDAGNFDLPRVGRQAIGAYVAGLRAPATAARAAPRVAPRAAPRTAPPTTPPRART